MHPTAYIIHTSNEKNLQKSAILFGTKSNAYLKINCPIFAYSWLFLSIFAYLRICSKSPRIYFAFRAEYPYLFLPIFRHLTCVIILGFFIFLFYILFIFFYCFFVFCFFVLFSFV